MRDVRPAAVAGMFYPGEAAELAASVRECLAGNVAPLAPAASPKALIVPHAGYVYSGPIAAGAYARLASVRSTIRRVVILGPTHRVAVRGLALPSVRAFATPLGDVEVDREAAAALAGLRQVVVSDSAQYYTGRAFGRRKLAPVISPKKTVEGAIGGAVFGTIAGVAFAHYWVPAIPMAWAAVMAMLMAIAGMAGDLFESAMKRRVGLKDSGNLIPGHGGILDRIDSWLFAAPVFWVFLKLFAQAGR